MPLKLSDIDIPPGWKVAEEDYILRQNDLFYIDKLQEKIIAFRGYRINALRKEQIRFKDAIFLRFDENYEPNFQVPDDFELVKNKSYKLKGGDFFFNDKNEKQYVNGWQGYTIKNAEAEGYSHHYFFYRKRAKPLTLEEKKLNSRKFVDSYIKNPSKKDYEKFESVFLREDNFGM